MRIDNINSQSCSCNCGHVTFDVFEMPLFRILCHCTICQRFNGANYADIIVCDAAHVKLPNKENLKFQSYKFPPIMKRGKCVKCDTPAIEIFKAPLFPSLTMIPVSMFRSDFELPRPVAHIFYEERISNSIDDYPKYQGFLMSQLTSIRYILATKLSRKKWT